VYSSHVTHRRNMCTAKNLSKRNFAHIAVWCVNAGRNRIAKYWKSLKCAMRWFSRATVCVTFTKPRVHFFSNHYNALHNCFEVVFYKWFCHLNRCKNWINRTVKITPSPNDQLTGTLKLISVFSHEPNHWFILSIFNLFDLVRWEV
jgi:hypothetical protein